MTRAKDDLLRITSGPEEVAGKVTGEKMIIATFAEQNSLKIEKDECGDPVIRGRCGHIYQYGPGTLGVCIMSKAPSKYRWNRARTALLAAGMKITQNGDGEGCATFDPENVTQAKTAMLHAMVKARKKLSQEVREAMLANLVRAREVRMQQIR